MSPIFLEKLFHKNPFSFRISTDFEADNEIDNSNRCNETTIVYKQNTVPNGYFTISELEGVLVIGYYKPLLGYNNVDLFVKEVIKLEKKRFSTLKTLRKISL